MKLQVVAAAQGREWVRNAFRVFFRKPLSFFMLFFMYMVGGQLLMWLWPVGPVLLVLLLPLGSLVFMIATERSLQGRFAPPSVFIEPLRVDRKRLRAQLEL